MLTKMETEADAPSGTQRLGACRLVGPVGPVPAIMASRQAPLPTPLAGPWPPATSAHAASAVRGGASAAVDRLQMMMMQDGQKTLADFGVRVCLSRLQTAHAHKSH